MAHNEHSPIASIAAASAAGQQPHAEQRRADAGFAKDVPEDQLHPDPLLDCLVELTRIHGRPSTRAALSAGLPLSKQGLTPSLFARAASHAGFSAKVVRRAFDKIDSALLPAILLLENNEACVLLGWENESGKARLLFPDASYFHVRIFVLTIAHRHW